MRAAAFRTRWVRSALAGIAAVVTGFCAGCRRNAAADAFCELGAEHEVARTVAKDFDAIEVVRLGEGAVAFWSVTGGLFAQAIDARGVRVGESRRLGVRCEGGLDALADEHGIDVACLLHPSRGKHEEPGGVLLHRLGGDLRVRQTRSIGSAGSQSQGVTIARGAHGLELAWHDGSSEAHRVLWAAPGRQDGAPRAVSEPGRMAQAPSMVRRGERALLTWAENWIDGGELASRIVAFDREAGAPRTLLAHAHVAAMPQLFALGRALGLGYRDRASQGEKTGLYLTELPPRGRAGHIAQVGRKMRVGRADGVGRPAIEPCMDGLVTATPRTYGGDYFVGVNWLDRGLGRTRGEQQFYEDSHAFTQVAAACLGDHALLLIAEFPQLQRRTAALRAVAYRCR